MSSVLITGTSSGIGLETALTLGRAGHTVYATMRNPERAPKLRGAITSEKLPVEIHTMNVDVDDSVSSAISAIRSRAGFIDVLVNNAGVERRGSVEEFDLADFRATMETNYFGALRCIRELLPDMRKRRNGCIVSVVIRGGPDGRITARALLRLEVCPGGAQRSTGSRNEATQCPGGDR